VNRLWNPQTVDKSLNGAPGRIGSKGHEQQWVSSGLADRGPNAGPEHTDIALDACPNKEIHAANESKSLLWLARHHPKDQRPQHWPFGRIGSRLGAEVAQA
jgi:hypothetical protein